MRSTRALIGILTVTTLGATMYAQTTPVRPAAPAAPPAAKPATPAQAPATPPATKPAAPRPAAPRPAATVGSTVTIQTTDPSGLPLSSVQVTASGPLARDGATAEDGTLRFANMRVGGYRLRFVKEGSITLERDIIVRTNEPQLVDVMLSAAPPALKPVEAPRPDPANDRDKALGPPADPKLTPIPSFVEKNFIGGREGRKDSPLGCTSTGTATLVQLREAIVNQTRDDADEWVYIVAGEGTLRMNNADQKMQAGTFALVPHSIAHSIVPSGRNPLIFVSTVTGPPCAAR